MKEYVFESTIYSSEIGKGGAYVIFPYDLRAEWNKGRLKVQATFDGVDYQGSIVNMGLKNQDGSICYILGINHEYEKERTSTQNFLKNKHRSRLRFEER